MNKTAIVILSDSTNCSEEALGRVFNALATAYDFKNAGEVVKVIFQGTATRWPEQLEKPENPVNRLFLAVKDKVQGVSSCCTAIFYADASGYKLLNQNKIPGTTGLPSLITLKNEGYKILIF